jgi:hypothetical protein
MAKPIIIVKMLGFKEMVLGKLVLIIVRHFFDRVTNYFLFRVFRGYSFDK